MSNSDKTHMVDRVIKCSSSNIDWIGLNWKNKELVVQFQNGAMYKYFNIPPATFGEIVSAESIGAAFNSLVRETGKVFKKIEGN